MKKGTSQTRKQVEKGERISQFLAQNPKKPHFSTLTVTHLKLNSHALKIESGGSGAFDGGGFAQGST